MRRYLLLGLLFLAWPAHAAENWLLTRDRWGTASAMTLSEATIVLGSSVNYTVANLAGRSVGVAAKIDKAILPRR